MVTDPAAKLPGILPRPPLRNMGKYRASHSPTAPPQYFGKGTVVCPIHKCRVACGYIAVLPHTLVTKKYITHVLRWVSWVIHAYSYLSPSSPSFAHVLVDF